MLLAVVASVLVLVAVAASRRPAPRQGGGGGAPPPPKDKPKERDDFGAEDFVKTASSLIPAGVGGGGLAAGSTVAAGLVLSYGAGELGASLTGDKGAGLEGLVTGEQISLGKVTGRLNAVTGTAVNVGRAGGKEIDKALGGDGKTGTGVIAQAGGGTAAGLLTIFGWAAAASAFILTALVYAVGSIVSDLNRLSYGQKGALEDFHKEWMKVHGKVFAALFDGEGGLTPLSEAKALRISMPFTDGYLRQANRLAYLAWMKRGRGFLGLGTTDDAYHARFGMDRGYFVGAVGGGLLTTDPPEQSMTVEYYTKAEIPPGELTSYTKQVRVGWKEVYEDDPEAFYTYGMLGGPPARPNAEKFPTECVLWKSQGKGEKDFAYRSKCMQKVTKPIYEYRTYSVDPERQKWITAGERSANLAAYVKWMRDEQWGLGVRAGGHCNVGLAEGRFDGTSNGDGTLTFRDELWDWRQA